MISNDNPVSSKGELASCQNELRDVQAKLQDGQNQLQKIEEQLQDGRTQLQKIEEELQNGRTELREIENRKQISTNSSAERQLSDRFLQQKSDQEQQIAELQKEVESQTRAASECEKQLAGRPPAEGTTPEQGTSTSLAQGGPPTEPDMGTSSGRESLLADITAANGLPPPRGRGKPQQGLGNGPTAQENGGGSNTTGIVTDSRWGRLPTNVNDLTVTVWAKAKSLSSNVDQLKKKLSLGGFLGGMRAPLTTREPSPDE